MRHLPGTFEFPKSRTGKVAIGLIAVALASAGFLAVAELLISGMFASETILNARWITAPLIALALCGVLAAIASLVSVVVEQERSIFVGLSFFVGLIITYASINGL